MSATYFNTETGELLSEEEIVQRYYEKHKTGKFGWVKFYPKLFGVVKETVAHSRYDVVAYVIENTNVSTNQFVGSLMDIVNATGASERTVSRVMVGLQEADVIRPIANGIWMLNPAYFYTGHEGKARFLCEKYLSLRVRHAKNLGDKNADQSALSAKAEAIINGGNDYDDQ